MSNTINYPFGKAAKETFLYADDEINGVVKNQFTMADVSEGITGATDLNLEASDRLQVGAVLILEVTAISGATNTRTITLDDGVTGVNPTVAEGSTSPQIKWLQFIFDGTQFVLLTDTLIKAAV